MGKRSGAMKKMIGFFLLAASLGAILFVSPLPATLASATTNGTPQSNSLEENFTIISGGLNPRFLDTIEDVNLRQALETLSTHQEIIRLWDGKTVSGWELVNFLKNKGIPVKWASEGPCKDVSCSQLFFFNGVYVYEDGIPGADPIYINPTIKDQTALMRSLSHEIFHRTQPFGKVLDTQLEEYWAFFVEAQISGSAWPVFDGYDPQDPASLRSWFITHRLPGYLDLEAYPQG
jgi:hypothetical protein